MNNLPKVSVIIPTYNRPQLIGRAIKSVLEQSYKNIEIIIIDGSLNNETEKVIQPYLTDSRIRYFHEPDVHTNTVKDRGNIAKTRNKAVRIAQGKYIAPLDDDDYWCDSQKLKKQVQFLEEHPDYSLCAGGVIGIGKKSSGEVFTIGTLYPEQDKDLRRLMLAPEGIVHSSIMFKRKDWETIGGYDEINPLGEDFDLHLKLGKIGKIYSFQDYFTTYTIPEQEKEHIIKYGRKCIANSIRLIIKHRTNYPGFYKYLFVYLISYLYSFVPFFFKKLFFPIRSKLKQSLRRSFNISEKKLL